MNILQIVKIFFFNLAKFSVFFLLREVFFLKGARN